MTNFTQWIKTSHTIKFAAVGILILLLLIPTNMVENLIVERQSQNLDVIHEISSKWGNEQTIAGPVINIPYREIVTSKNEKGETVASTTMGTLHFLPEQLDIAGEIKTEIKHRSIYEAVVYSTTLKITGTFNKTAVEKLGIEAENVLWDKAY